VATLLEAARRLVAESPARRETLRLRFMGGNEGLDAAAIARAGLAPWPEIVETIPSRPHVESLAAMRRANLLVLLGHGGDADSQIYTGKIYEYLTSGRPVLGILDPGPAADLIDRSGHGAACRPGDVESALASIRAPLGAWEAGQGVPDFPLPAMAPAWERRTMARRAGELLDLLVSRR
jgi:hypothetical protein